MTKAPDHAQLIAYAQAVIGDTLAERPELRHAAILLIGSRAHGRASETSDWDLLALAHGDPPRETIPLVHGEIEVLGARGREAREAADLPIWQFELSHAILVHDGWTHAQAYRTHVAERFAEIRPALARAAWSEFRLFRNQAFASLERRDSATIALTTALAARSAARALLLWQNEPYPSDKWLLDVARDAGTGQVADLCIVVMDASSTREERARALGSLTTTLEDHMTLNDADWTALGDWWFNL